MLEPTAGGEEALFKSKIKVDRASPAGAAEASGHVTVVLFLPQDG